MLILEQVVTVPFCLTVKISSPLEEKNDAFVAEDPISITKIILHNLLILKIENGLNKIYRAYFCHIECCCVILKGEEVSGNAGGV